MWNKDLVSFASHLDYLVGVMLLVFKCEASDSISIY